MQSEQSEPIYNFLGSMIVFHGVVQFATLFLSALKIALHFPFPQLILLLALAAACGFWRRGKSPEETDENQTKPQTRLPYMIIVSAGLIYVLLCIVGYVAEEVTWDGNAYHLPAIYFWNMKGYVHWIDDELPLSMFMNGYPKAVELTAFVITHAFHSDAIVNAVNMLFYPLGVMGLAYLAKSLGASRPWAWFAGAAWLLIPINIFQAATLYVDCSFASCIIAFLAAMVHVLLNFPASSFRGKLRAMLILGAAGGLVIGGKSSGITIVGLGFLAVTFAFAYRWARERGAGIFTAVIMPLLCAATVSSAVGGYWYLRNYLVKGSPLYPAGLSIANYRIFPGLEIDQFVGFEGNTAPELRGLPVYMRVLKIWFQHRGWGPDFFCCDTRVGGLGYFWPAACLPAVPGLLAYLMYKRKWKTLEILLLLLIITGVAFLIQPMNWWSRFTVWIYVVGLPSFAALASVFYIRQTSFAAINTEEFGGNKPLLRRRPFGARILGGTPSTWASTCMLILAIEGWNCCFWACTWATFSRISEIKQMIGYRYSPGNQVLWPKLRGTVFDEIFSSDVSLAISQIEWHADTNYPIIMGGLSTANSKRQIVMVNKNPNKETIDSLIAEGVRYLIWDDTNPLPDFLKQGGFPREKAEVFYVFKLMPGEQSARVDTGRSIK